MCFFSTGKRHLGFIVSGSQELHFLLCKTRESPLARKILSPACQLFSWGLSNWRKAGRYGGSMAFVWTPVAGERMDHNWCLHQHFPSRECGKCAQRNILSCRNRDQGRHGEGERKEPGQWGSWNFSMKELKSVLGDHLQAFSIKYPPPSGTLLGSSICKTNKS